MSAYCPECETDLDPTTGTCPACRWDPDFAHGYSTLRRSRTGYGVLTLHPEGPVLNDLYLVQETRVIADFAAGLFPPKGWLPGRFLLALLPPEPR